MTEVDDESWKKKEKEVKNLCTDQRQAFKRTKQIRNKQRSRWLYYTTQVPHTKGPTCWASVGGGGAVQKMGYIWQLNKRKETERNKERGKDGERQRKGSREELKKQEKALSDERRSSPIQPILSTPPHRDWLKCVSSCLH